MRFPYSFQIPYSVSVGTFFEIRFRSSCFVRYWKYFLKWVSHKKSYGFQIHLFIINFSMLWLRSLIKKSIIQTFCQSESIFLFHFFVTFVKKVRVEWVIENTLEWVSEKNVVESKFIFFTYFKIALYFWEILSILAYYQALKG